MGLAASQARLLSITSRMSDTELRSQLINNAKMRLTTDSAKVSDEYIAALNQTQMMFTNFDSAGNERYQNLTFNSLTAYSSYNNQYGLVNNNGQLLVSSLDANNFVASGQDVNNFLRLYGLEQTTTYWDTLETSQEYRDYGVGYYDDFGEWQKFDVTDVAELKAMYEGTPDAVGIAHYGLEPSFNSVEYETYEILLANYKAAKQNYQTKLNGITRNFLTSNATNLYDTINMIDWSDSDVGDSGVTIGVLGIDTRVQNDVTFDSAYEQVFGFVADATQYIKGLDDWCNNSNWNSGTLPPVNTHVFRRNESDTAPDILFFNGISTFDQLHGWRDRDSCVGIYRILNMYMDFIYQVFTSDNTPSSVPRDPILGLGLWGTNAWDSTHGTATDEFDHPFSYSPIGWQSGCVLDPHAPFFGEVNSILENLQREINAAASMPASIAPDGNTFDPYIYPGPSNDNAHPTGGHDHSEYSFYNAPQYGVITNPDGTTSIDYDNVIEEGCQQHLVNALGLLAELYRYVKTELPNSFDEEELRGREPELQTLFNEYREASENLCRFIWGGAMPGQGNGAQICDDMFGANVQYKYYEHLDDPAWILSTYNEYPPTDTGIVQGSPHENPYYLQYGTTTTYDGQAVPIQIYNWDEPDPTTPGAMVSTPHPLPTSYQAVKDILILQCMLDHYGEPKYTWIDIYNPDENADAKVRWYTNLFNRMMQGYEIIPSGLENSSDWIQFAFESGMVHLEQVNNYDQWVSLMYSNCTGITESAVDVDITLAEAKYKREMAKIEAKDKRYDMELKTLDTEHESLKQEYEQIKKVIKTNIDRNMKMFQMG